jgi:GMP synthase (glutamine-hydrolysing)
LKRILFLQNGTERYAPSRVDLRFQDAGFTVDSYWAFSQEFPENVEGYAGAYLSGSPQGAYEDIPWIHQEHRLIVQLSEKRVPMLGVCFGSQILASALCGRDQVFRRSRCDVGYKWIDLSPPPQGDPLLRNLERRVYMFVWHNDEVRHDHPDMRILGSTDLCPNHIWRLRDLPVWGIQGHPELTRDQATLLFHEKRERFEQDGASMEKLLIEADEAIEAKKLITNFMTFCSQDAS